MRSSSIRGRPAPGLRKFGVYDSDRPAFDWVRAEVADAARCLEAQVMDWADDVAYSVHDVEDGVHAGHIRLPVLAAEAERAALCQQAAECYSPLPAPALLPALDRLLELPPLRDLAEFDGTFRAQGLAKRATSELTGRFVSAAVSATRDKFGTGAARPLHRGSGGAGGGGGRVRAAEGDRLPLRDVAGRACPTSWPSNGGC